MVLLNAYKKQESKFLAHSRYSTRLLSEEHRGVTKDEISGIWDQSPLVCCSDEQDLRVRCNQKQMLACLQRASIPSWLLLQSSP